MSESDKKKVDEATRDPLLDHEYDGIRELDNPLPGWWLGTFYITIIFSGIYVLYYHLWNGPTIEDEYRTDVAQVEQLNAENEKKFESSIDNLAELVVDPKRIALGKEKFTALCSSCHGVQGQGGIGPNLTDAYWIHGDGSPEENLKVIKKGILEKGNLEKKFWKQNFEHKIW